MRKKYPWVWFMIIIITFSFIGCQASDVSPKYPDAEGIEPAVALALRKDYLRQFRSEYPDIEVTLEEINVQHYYGTYSGCEIVYMGAPLAHTDAERSVVVAGYIITLGSSQKLYVHKEGHFYTLAEAYDAGYITTEDVEAFGPKVDNYFFRKWDGEQFSEDGFLVVPVDWIAPDVRSKLQKDYLRQFGTKYPEMKMTLDEINVQGYYGTYSGCEIVYLWPPILRDTTIQCSEVVAGYIITFTSDTEPYVHKEDSFYTIKEAYDAGYITTEDVEDFGPMIDVNFRKWNGEAFLERGSMEPDVALRLRKDYLQQLHSEKPKTRDIVLEQIWVQNYYGTYNGCEIVYMGAPLESITSAERSVIVGGYIFILGHQKLYVHKDHHFYTIEEAYDAGYITTEDVAEFGPKVNDRFRKWDG